LAAKFTQGELAVLKVVADEVRSHGGCDRSYDELAARAGCCRTLARRAVRLAGRMGLLSIEMRPRPGRKHLTNILRVIDPSWRAWLRIGGTERNPTGKQKNKGLEKRGREPARTTTHGSTERRGERGVSDFRPPWGEWKPKKRLDERCQVKESFTVSSCFIHEGSAIE
jgi:hypothetical protein